MLSKKTLIERIRYLRMRKEKTQRQVADFLKIPIHTYIGYESERRSFPIDLLPKIADFFGVSVDYLLGRERDFKYIIEEFNLKSLEDLKGALPIIIKKYGFYLEDLKIDLDLNALKKIIDYVRVLAEAQKYRELKKMEENLKK